MPPISNAAYMNDQKLTLSLDYVVSDNVITFMFAPKFNQALTVDISSDWTPSTPYKINKRPKSNA